jgi:ribokinase
MAGKLGRDAFGEQYLDALQADGVETSLISREEATATGVAVIEVDANGENHIVVVPGANMTMDADYLREPERRRTFAGAAACLLQLEVPVAANRTALALAREAGVPSILDPAPVPADPVPDDLLSMASYVTPNETEARLLTGVAVAGEDSAAEAGAVLRRRGAASVIIKAGASGAFIVDEAGTRHIPGFSVSAVDSTAAGDAFNAGLAHALGSGLDLDEAVRRANAVGALACTKLGAQSALPHEREVAELLESL